MKNLALYLLFSLWIATPASAWRESHGGDSTVMEFRELSALISEDLNAIAISRWPKDLVDFPQAFRKVATVLDIQSAYYLAINGVQKDAINYPFKNPPRLLINQRRWAQLSYKQKEKLILHEMLHLAHYDDHDYQLSLKIFALLDQRIPPSSSFADEWSEAERMSSSCQVGSFATVAEKINPWALNEQGKNLLHLAIESHCSEIVKILLNLAHDRSAFSVGLDPYYLSVVAAQKHISKGRSFAESLAVIEMLRVAGANVNRAVSQSMAYGASSFMRCSGETALMRAVIGYNGKFPARSQKILQTILNTPGINLNHRDSCQDTAYEKAVLLALPDVIVMLSNMGMKPDSFTKQRLRMLLTYNPFMTSWSEISLLMSEKSILNSLDGNDWLPEIVESYLGQPNLGMMEPGVEEVVSLLARTTSAKSFGDAVNVLLNIAASDTQISERLLLDVADLLGKQGRSKIVDEVIVRVQSHVEITSPERWKTVLVKLRGF